MTAKERPDSTLKFIYANPNPSPHPSPTRMSQFHNDDPSPNSDPDPDSYSVWARPGCLVTSTARSCYRGVENDCNPNGKQGVASPAFGILTATHGCLKRRHGIAT